VVDDRACQWCGTGLVCGTPGRAGDVEVQRKRDSFMGEVLHGFVWACIIAMNGNMVVVLY
jgi:hypothetical protein